MRNELIIGKNILATIIYYDVMDFPMTSFEIHKHLIRSDYSTVAKEGIYVATLCDVVGILHSRKLAGFINVDHGFYHLKGRDELVEKRINAQKLSVSKIRKLLSVAKWVQYVPFVSMVAVTGKLAMGQAHKKSDLDLLIALKDGKIWTGRTLVTAFVHLIGKRRWGRHISDRLCLNYFISDEHLEISHKDLFSANEYMFAFSLLGWDIFKRFQLRNIWISSMKPSYALNSLPDGRIIAQNEKLLNLKKIGEKIFSHDWLETFLKNVEQKRIMQNPLTDKEGSLVYASDETLIFLPDPHGPRIFEKFKSAVAKLGA